MTDYWPDFPASKWDGETCPACRAERTVRYVEDAAVTRYLAVDESGALYAYDYRTEDGTNDRIECYSCGVVWLVPEDIDYR